MEYRNSTASVPEIGRQLGVAYVLEGSVQLVGRRIRVQAQLVDARTDEHLWADSFDRKLKNVFTVQSELADQITRALRNQILSNDRPGESPRMRAMGPTAERSPEIDPEALDLYFRAQYLRRRQDSTLARAIELYRRALEREPEFARAYGGLAMASYWAYMDVIEHPDEHADSILLRSARTAITLDSTVADAQAALGSYYMTERRWTRAERKLEEALRFNPSHAEARRE